MNDNNFERCYHPNKYECANCIDGKCHILSSTWFGGRQCPFFKTRKDIVVEKAKTIKRLSEIGKIDFQGLSEVEKKYYTLTKEEKDLLKRYGYEHLLR